MALSTSLLSRTDPHAPASNGRLPRCDTCLRCWRHSTDTNLPSKDKTKAKYHRMSIHIHTACCRVFPRTPRHGLRDIVCHLLPAIMLPCWTWRWLHTIIVPAFLKCIYMCTVSSATVDRVVPLPEDDGSLPCWFELRRHGTLPFIDKVERLNSTACCD